MSLPVRFTGDLAELPTHAYGHRSLTWWGVVAFFMIEGTAFALAIGAYFYLMGAEQTLAARALSAAQPGRRARSSPSCCC